MKNNKGFTFVELLVVIALLSIVLILTISQVQRVNNNSKIKLCKNKLSLIEESLNLYLDNNRDLFSNSGLCEEEPVSNICYTSVLKIAEQGIIDYDKNKNIINPVNNKILNDYKVKIIYDSGNDKFSSEIQKENETVSDKNYDTICGKSTGIKEEDNDKSIFDKKSYGFNVIKIEEDGSEVVINFNAVEKAPNEIGNYCKDLNFHGKDEYSYVNYEIENDTTVNCIYKKQITYNLSIINGNGIVIDNIDKYTNKKYKPNESVTIKFRIEGNYLYDSISCNTSSCEYNSEDSTIKVTFKTKEDIVLTINSKDMLNVKMFYENPDTDFYDYDSSGDKLVATGADAENYCKSNVRNNYEYFMYDSSDNSCYYKLKRTNLSFDLSDTNIVSVLVDPGSKTMSATTSTINDYYKYGQKITLKVNYKNGYEYDSIVCMSGECTLNDNGTITLVSYADSVSIAPKSKKIPPKYMVYNHYQDADDINGYSSVLMNNSVAVDDTISDSTLLSNFCDTVENYNFISSISYYDKSNHEVNCYYDRKLFNVTFKKGDKYVSGFNLIPSSNSIVSNENITDSSVTKTYRFGQEILTSILGYSSDYEYKSIICSDTTKCNISKNGVGKIIVPTNNNFTVTYNSQDIVQKFNIYYHYQDADDGNGYSVLKKYTTNISLPANYDSSDPDLTNRDLINSKKICESENVLTHFTYNNAISYLDRSKSEINCYFDRELVSVTFDKSDSYVTGVTVAPTDNNSVGSTSITSTTTYKYRYGQEVFMKINGYANDYMYKEVSCINSTLCIIGNDGTTKVVANENMTVKPISKPIEIPFRVYNHYQDANDGDGYTAEYIETIGIVLSLGDDTNFDNVCRKKSIDHFTYNKNISYLDRSKKEINCYFDRELVSVTFDKSDSYITGVTVAPTNNNSVKSTSITTTTTYKYRYGQEIFMKINGYANDYMYKGISCSNSTLCTIGKDGTTKVVANENMTVKPISKPVELAYKLYNHYQDSNNINGYTILELKDINVVLSLGDSANVTNFCSKEGKNGYYLLNAVSYLDRSKNEINCYFNIK
ncbi:MAG: type II secretion system protein [Bacilli bacterium]|nr:type II secretion system protein [Bacilli bacterium]